MAITRVTDVQMYIKTANTHYVLVINSNSFNPLNYSIR